MMEYRCIIQCIIDLAIQVQQQKPMFRKNHKAEAIDYLRSKILELRTQLQNLQMVEIKLSPARMQKQLQAEHSHYKIFTSPNKSKSANPQSSVRVSNKSRSKDPNQEQYASVSSKNSTPDKSPLRGRDRKSHTLRLDLSNLLPSDSSAVSRYEKMFLPKSVSRSPSQSRTHSNSSFGGQSTRKFLRFDEEGELQTPRFERKQSIKTYKFSATNPILNPPEEKIHRRRMFAQKSQKPQNLYLNHSDSNQNMFFCPQRQQLLLSSKSKGRLNNTSQRIGDLLQPKSGKSTRLKESQQRRHYPKQFNQTAGSLMHHR